MAKHQPKFRREPLHQVFVEVRKDGVDKLIPVGPKCGQELCTMIISKLRSAIVRGKLPGFGNAHIARVLEN